MRQRKKKERGKREKKKERKKDISRLGEEEP